MKPFVLFFNPASKWNDDDDSADEWVVGTLDGEYITGYQIDDRVTIDSYHTDLDDAITALRALVEKETP